MNNQAWPKISVVIPVLNGEKTLEKAIRSVLDQNYENTELIVIDGCSKDSTLDIIKRYELNITYWQSREDKSCGLAINYGLQQATGELTAQLMADDWFEPGTFQAIANAYIANPGIDVITCGGRIVRLNPITQQYETVSSHLTPKQLELNLYNMCFGLPVMSSRFISKTYLQKVGLMKPFDAEGNHNFSADRELLARMALHGCKEVVIDHLGHTYFAHENSATFSKSRTNQLKIYREHMTMVDHYFMTRTLTAEQRAILLSWYTDQSVRLFIFACLNNDYKSAWNIMKDGYKRSNIKWLYAVVAVPIKKMRNKG